MQRYKIGLRNIYDKFFLYSCKNPRSAYSKSYQYKTMHLHIIGIGGIGVSALARFYRRSLGWHVTGSDASDFSFRERLESE